MIEVYADASKTDGCIGLGYDITGPYILNQHGGHWIRGDYTTMEAEFFALVEGIKLARAYDEDGYVFYTDAKPLVDKITGNLPEDKQWRTYHRATTLLLREFDSARIEWVSRDYNERANRQAREAMWSGEAFLAD